MPESPLILGACRTCPVPIRAPIASFDVARFLVPAPKGRQQFSPGQRPGYEISKLSHALCKGGTTSDPSALRAHPLGTRNRMRDTEARSAVSLFRGWGDHVCLTFPGRCPGLHCLGPFGARFECATSKSASERDAAGGICWTRGLSFGRLPERLPAGLISRLVASRRSMMLRVSSGWTTTIVRPLGTVMINSR